MKKYLAKIQKCDRLYVERKKDNKERKKKMSHRMIGWNYERKLMRERMREYAKQQEAKLKQEQENKEKKEEKK